MMKWFKKFTMYDDIETTATNSSDPLLGLFGVKKPVCKHSWIYTGRTTLQSVSLKRCIKCGKTG